MASFDDVFNYDNAITGLTNDISTDQNTLQQLQTELGTYTAMGDEWASITAEKISELQVEIERLQNLITLEQETLTEIQSIVALPSDQKQTLYTIFLSLNEVREMYMIRIPFNVQTALADPDVIKLLTDTSLDSASKKLLASLLYQKYQINSAHTRPLMNAYRYLLVNKTPDVLAFQ
jgi:hypothetical protein